MNDEILTWEITPTEQRGENQKILIFLFSSLPIFIGIIISATFASKENFFIKNQLQVVFYVILVVVGIILLALIINKLFPYQKRVYYFDHQRITISKGHKTKSYLWSDFECFYQYASQRGQQKSSRNSSKFILKEDIERISEVAEKIQGHSFYLRRKKVSFLSKLYKIFVVIYSKPDNSKAVKKNLSKHLPQMAMESNTDLGLVFYQFR